MTALHLDKYSMVTGVGFDSLNLMLQVLLIGQSVDGDTTTFEFSVEYGYLDADNSYQWVAVATGQNHIATETRGGDEDSHVTWVLYNAMPLRFFMSGGDGHLGPTGAVAQTQPYVEDFVVDGSVTNNSDLVLDGFNIEALPYIDADLNIITIDAVEYDVTDGDHVSSPAWSLPNSRLYRLNGELYFDPNFTCSAAQSPEPSPVLGLYSSTPAIASSLASTGDVCVQTAMPRNNAYRTYVLESIRIDSLDVGLDYEPNN